MILDNSKIEGRMREKHITQKEIANALGSSPATVCLKLKGKYKFTQDEIAILIDCLGIKDFEIKDIFFTEKV